MQQNSDHIIVTLPSDTSPDNTASNFTTQLPYPLEFTQDWEVGLWSLIYTKSWGTLSEKQILSVEYATGVQEVGEDHVSVTDLTNSVDIEIKGGQYRTIKQLLKMLDVAIQNAAISDPNIGLVKITYLKDEGRVQILLPSTKFKLTFVTPELRDILGFTRDIVSSNIGFHRSNTDPSSKGEEIPAIIEDLHSIFVYTDIASPQIVGNTESDLIEIVPTTVEFGQTSKFVPRNISYIPLLNNRISSVHIQLGTASGKLINFAKDQRR